jgi:hypothetical protein
VAAAILDAPPGKVDARIEIAIVVSIHLKFTGKTTHDRYIG